MESWPLGHMFDTPYLNSLALVLRLPDTYALLPSAICFEIMLENVWMYAWNAFSASSHKCSEQKQEPLNQHLVWAALGFKTTPILLCTLAHGCWFVASCNSRLTHLCWDQGSVGTVPSVGGLINHVQKIVLNNSAACLGSLLRCRVNLGRRCLAGRTAMTI